MTLLLALGLINLALTDRQPENSQDARPHVAVVAARPRIEALGFARHMSAHGPSLHFGAMQNLVAIGVIADIE